MYAGGSGNKTEVPHHRIQVSENVEGEFLFCRPLTLDVIVFWGELGGRWGGVLVPMWEAGGCWGCSTLV